MNGTDSVSSPSRRAFLGGSLAVAALVVAGCTKAAGNTGGGSGSQRVVTVGLPSDVVLSNLLRQVAVNFPVHALVFDTLVSLDNQSRKVVPRVARSWSWNTDYTVLKMTLRSDVKFHTGRVLGPQDVLFSVKQVQDPANGAQIQAVASYITSAVQSGPHEVTFTLKSPLSDFIDMFLMMPLIDDKTFSGLASGTKVVGTGPFKWDSWTPGTQLQLSRNAGYWEAGEPRLDTVTMKIYSQSQALLAALQSAEIDMSYMMLPRDAATFANKPGYTTVTTSPTFTDWYLGVNVTAEPFTDVRVRQAVAWAIDRDRIASQVFSGFGTASCVPALPSFPGLSGADTSYYTYDPAKAKQLLSQAGKQNPAITILANSAVPTQSAILTIVQNNLEAVGFKVTPSLLDSASYQKQVQSSTVQGMWVGPVDATAISLPLTALITTPLKAGKNTSHVTDPAYKKLAQEVITAGPAQQPAANRAYISYLLDQAFHLTVVHGYYMAVVRSTVSGVTTTGTAELDLASASAT